MSELQTMLDDKEKARGFRESGFGHGLAAAWVRLRAAFGDGVAVSVRETNPKVPPRRVCAFSISVSIYLLPRSAHSSRTKTRTWRT